MTGGWTVDLGSLTEEEALELRAQLVGLVARIDAGLAALAERKADWRRRAEAAADANLPVLERARDEGTYVGRDERVRGPRGGIPCADGFWVGTTAVLAERGARVQAVDVTRPAAVGGGFYRVGYRLAPEGDERPSVELDEVHPRRQMRL